MTTQVIRKVEVGPMYEVERIAKFIGFKYCLGGRVWIRTEIGGYPTMIKQISGRPPAVFDRNPYTVIGDFSLAYSKKGDILGISGVNKEGNWYTYFFSKNAPPPDYFTPYPPQPTRHDIDTTRSLIRYTYTLLKFFYSISPTFPSTHYFLHKRDMVDDIIAKTIYHSNIDIAHLLTVLRKFQYLTLPYTTRYDLAIKAIIMVLRKQFKMHTTE